MRKGPHHLLGAALPLKRVGEEGLGVCRSQAPSCQSPWVAAARRVRHMLLFSSLSPEAAWQQAPLAVFTAYLPTLMLSLPPLQVGATTPVPREPEDRRSGHTND